MQNSAHKQEINCFQVIIEKKSKINNWEYFSGESSLVLMRLGSIGLDLYLSCTFDLRAHDSRGEVVYSGSGSATARTGSRLRAAIAPCSLSPAPTRLSAKLESKAKFAFMPLMVSGKISYFSEAHS